ncbi:N-formylglutamate deformylase [Cutibacterium acnes JCM 18909]|nr:N-formylglutamate deformylase [Cutibacterium acnes JCM 18909]
MTTWTAASLLAEIAAIGRNEDGSYSRFCLRPEEVAAGMVRRKSHRVRVGDRHGRER